jgi:hypothetical protein
VNFHLDFESDPGVLIVSLSGTVTLDELNDYQDTYLSDPRWTPGTSMLTDCRALEVGDFGSDDVRLLAEANLLKADRFGFGRAAVVVSEPAAFGLVRMFQAYTDEAGFNQRVFTSIEAARDWLHEPSDADLESRAAAGSSGAAS